MKPVIVDFPFSFFVFASKYCDIIDVDLLRLYHSQFIFNTYSVVELRSNIFNSPIKFPKRKTSRKKILI